MKKLLVFCVLAILLAACGSSTPTPPPLPHSSNDDIPPGTMIQPLVGQTIWFHVEENLYFPVTFQEFGTLSVPKSASCQTVALGANGESITCDGYGILTKVSGI